MIFFCYDVAKRLLKGQIMWAQNPPTRKDTYTSSEKLDSCCPGWDQICLLVLWGKSHVNDLSSEHLNSHRSSPTEKVNEKQMRLACIWIRSYRKNKEAHSTVRSPTTSCVSVPHNRSLFSNCWKKSYFTIFQVEKKNVILSICSMTIDNYIKLYFSNWTSLSIHFILYHSLYTLKSSLTLSVWYLLLTWQMKRLITGHTGSVAVSFSSFFISILSVPPSTVNPLFSDRSVSAASSLPGAEQSRSRLDLWD